MPNSSIASFYNANHLTSSTSSSPIHQTKFGTASFQSTAPQQPQQQQQQTTSQAPSQQVVQQQQQQPPTQSPQIDAGETDKVVGYGAFGVVWSVTDPRNGRRVALKKMPNVFQTIVSAKRVFREVKMLCTLKHDNVSHRHLN